MALDALRSIRWIRSIMVGLGGVGVPPGFVGVRSLGVTGEAGCSRQTGTDVVAMAFEAIGEANLRARGGLGAQPSMLEAGFPPGGMARSIGMAGEAADLGDSTRGKGVRRGTVAGDALTGVLRKFRPVVLQPVGWMLARCGIELGRIAVGAASAAPQ